MKNIASEKLFIGLLLGGLIISPLVFWPNAPVPYEVPRVWFILRWIEVLGILFIFTSIKSLKKKNLDSWLIVFVVGFVFISIVASFLGVDLYKSFWGNYYRGDGLFTLFHFIFFFLIISLVWQAKWKNYFAIALNSGAFLTSLWALVSGIRFFIFKDYTVSHWIDGTIGVSFGQPQFLAGFLLVSLPFTIYLLKISKTSLFRAFFLISIIIQTVAIAFTRSFAGILGIGLLVVLEIFLCTNFQKKIVIICGLLFLLFASFVIFVRFNQEKGFVAEARERIFRKVMTATVNRPLFGWGWANVDFAFESVDWPIKLQNDVYVDKAHSMILEVFATTGIAGLFIYLAILSRVGQKLIMLVRTKSKNYLWHEALFIAFVLYIFHSQTNVISIGEEIVFWLIIGIVCNLSLNKLDK